MSEFKKILVTGGAGYVGSRLVPKLLAEGYQVRVLDIFLFGSESLNAVKGNPNLELITGDIRDETAVVEAIRGCDVVMHLACISNDSSYDHNPTLAKAINLDCFPMMVKAAKSEGVKRFIFPSSSSVYGVRSESQITEDLVLEPFTGYSSCKAQCEEILLKEQSPDFTVFTFRPAAVCGYSPRMKLDITVNILTTCAVVNGKIRLFGGSQKRPSLHIEDMCDFYLKSLEWTHDQINGKVYNVGCQNYALTEMAQLIKGVIGSHIEVSSEPTNDLRTYHICSDKVKAELNFVPQYSIESAVQDIVAAYAEGKITDPFNNPLYHNVKIMERLELDER